MTLATLGLAALISAPLAHAAPAKGKAAANRSGPKGHELSLELGSFGAPDPAWDFLADGDPVGSYGVRAGYGLSRNVTLVGSWHRSADGAEIEGPASEGEYDTLFRTAFISHQFAVGPKVQWRWKRWLAPYATLQGIGWLGKARLDDDFDDDENVNQYSYTGFAPGGMVTAGVDIKPLKLGKKVRVGSHLEAGYGITSRMTLTQDGGTDRANAEGEKAVELGAVGFRGFTLRWGVGVRF
jgi:hypothetical protein